MWEEETGSHKSVSKVTAWEMYPVRSVAVQLNYAQPSPAGAPKGLCENRPSPSEFLSAQPG